MPERRVTDKVMQAFVNAPAVGDAERSLRHALHAALMAAEPEAVLNDEEQEAMDNLLACMGIITQKWKLRTNSSELASAVHVLQGFIVQHMLGRIAPEHWSGQHWYGDLALAAGLVENADGEYVEADA